MVKYLIVIIVIIGLIDFTAEFILLKYLRKLFLIISTKSRNFIVCWFSINFWNIHTERDSITPIPDHYKEYKCKRCKMIYKL